ncbi:MAG: DUF6147 family protein [Lachnospiraceae bacterium]|jgi:hypothetical protein
MKALKRTLCSILICMLMMTNMAYAMPAISENSVDDDLRESVLLTDNEKTSSDSTNNSMRGIMLSAGLIEITNQEDGTLHISVDTYAHKIVDSIYQTVFLEVWDEKKENWVQVDHWDFEKSKAEDPELTSYHVGFTVTGCELNRYYRARAMHLVEWGDEAEAKVTQTNGVLLTDHAV